ncbi:hypothetical protein VNO80_30648 [Phaseolus coccineus]|uniref:Uncharacterized protein n=1 Tax=Phaseolus coccineus TaxID=3886 RepID=A0AAN9LGV0_PHACN
MLHPPPPQPRTFSLFSFKIAPPPQDLFTFTDDDASASHSSHATFNHLAFSRLPSPPIKPSLMHPSTLSLFHTHNIPSLSSTSLIDMPYSILRFQQFLIYPFPPLR